MRYEWRRKLRCMMIVKLLLSVLFMFTGFSGLHAEGIGSVEGKVSTQAQGSSVGLEAVKGIEIGLAVGSQKIAWDSHGLGGCRVESLKGRSRHCRCHSCRCFPVYRSGEAEDTSQKGSSCYWKCSTYSQNTSKRPIFFFKH